MQEERRVTDPETAKKIDEYCETLKEYASGKRLPFKFIVEDPSGNSYVQNPSAPTADQYCKKTHWVRSIEDYTTMGYPADQATIQAEADRLENEKGKITAANPMSHNYMNSSKKVVTQTKAEQEALIDKLATYSKRAPENAAFEAGYVDFSKPIDEQDSRNAVADDDPRKQVSKFPVPCYTCDKMGNVQMCYSSIPFFKEIILMAFVCDFCGYRNSEIKEGGGIGDKGKKITLKVENDEDLNRDVFKSATAKFTIPELGFDMDAGSLGSLYSTVEGLIMKAHTELELSNPFGAGDSKDSGLFLKFLEDLNELRSGKKPFTLVLDDPADNCFIYNQFAPEDDPKIIIEPYERSEEQNDELGITHMLTDPEMYSKKA